MRFAKLVQRFAPKRKADDSGATLQELSKALRSELVPAALRDAAHTIANLLDGSDANASGAAQGAVVINVSVAVAVGAPGKEQGADERDAGPMPNEAVVIASAIAGPPLKTSSRNAPDAAHGDAKDGESDAEASKSHQVV